MSYDVSDAEALMCWLQQHAGYKILEIFREEVLSNIQVSAVLGPEEVDPVHCKVFVVDILILSRSEGLATRVKNEKNDTEGE